MKSSKGRRLARGVVSDRGFILIVVLGIMTTLVMLTVSFLSLTRLEAEFVIHVSDAARTECAAWGAVDYLIATICNDTNGGRTPAFDGTGSVNGDSPNEACYIASRKDWWYREYMTRIHYEPTDPNDYRFGGGGGGDSGWAGDYWPAVAPDRESLWMYFPNEDQRAESQVRIEFHMMDENAFVNINDWLYDSAPTGAQMANMVTNLVPPCFFERDYMCMHGTPTREVLYIKYDGWKKLNWPVQGSEYAQFRRARLKPVEGWIAALGARRARKLGNDDIYEDLEGDESSCAHVISNQCYPPMEGTHVLWEWHTNLEEKHPWGVLEMLRYFNQGNGYPERRGDWTWNPSPYADGIDTSNHTSLVSLAPRTERLNYNDPDTGLSPINLNTCGRCVDVEVWEYWDDSGYYNTENNTAMNVAEALVPVEALWQLLIVNPADSGREADGTYDATTGNGTAAGDARVLISDALLEDFMTKNPEIAGAWDDPDGDLTTGTPATSTDEEDLKLYCEARQELVERMAWQLAYRYQEAVCRLLVGSWWDFRINENSAAWRDNDNQYPGYRPPGNNGTPEGTDSRPTFSYPMYQGWYRGYASRYDYQERYLWEPAWYALKGNSVDGSDFADAMTREDSTRWPQATKAQFWGDAGTTGLKQALFDISAAVSKVTITNTNSDAPVFDVADGYIDQWTADAIYNSLRPGIHTIHGTDATAYDGSGPYEPLTCLSYNEDHGCFDTRFKDMWSDNGAGGVDPAGKGTEDARFVGWRADNTEGAAAFIRFPTGGFPAYRKFGQYAPHKSSDVDPGKTYGHYKNTYTASVPSPAGGHGDGHSMKCYYPPKNMYVFNYGSFGNPTYYYPDGATRTALHWSEEEEPPGMMPRSVMLGKDGITRRQYWRKQFTPNSFATEVSNSSTHFRFVATAQLVDIGAKTSAADVTNVDDDRVYYERRIAGFFEIAPDLTDEDVGAGWANGLHVMTSTADDGADTYSAADGFKTQSGKYDCGEWYANGMPAYWRRRLNMEGWRMQADRKGWDANSSDFPSRNQHDWLRDPRYRQGEAPLGQHDRWYDYRGWDPSHYGGAAQTRKRIQFLHFIDNNLL